MNNLLSIYSAMTGKTIEQTVAEFEGCGYGTLKTAVADAVIAEIEPVQTEYRRILADKAELEPHNKGRCTPRFRSRRKNVGSCLQARRVEMNSKTTEAVSAVFAVEH